MGTGSRSGGGLPARKEPLLQIQVQTDVVGNGTLAASDGDRPKEQVQGTASGPGGDTPSNSRQARPVFVKNNVGSAAWGSIEQCVTPDDEFRVKVHRLP